jgi:acyl dehydratase
MAYTYEDGLKVLPTFGVVPALEAFEHLNSIPGIAIDMTKALHGEHDLTAHAPVPTEGTVESTVRIADIWDKGKAALIIVEVLSYLEGKLLWTNRFSCFAIGEGGFGGESGPTRSVTVPERAPDIVSHSPTMPHQALLYRLSGDKNPLHADPAFAAEAGFKKPILQGLCTYGIVAKAVVDSLCEGQVTAIEQYSVRFVGIVFPGETVVTSMWDEGSRVIVSASTAERGEPVLANAVLALHR